MAESTPHNLQHSRLCIICAVVACAVSIASCQRAPKPSTASAPDSRSSIPRPLDENGSARGSASLPAGDTTATADTPAFDTLLRVAGGECNDAARQGGCTAGDFDLELHPGCGSDGLFAGVSGNAGAILLDAAPPNDTTRRAALAKGQLVCAQATASAGQSPAWYYVTAVPAASVAACAGNKLCEMYGDRDVVWHDEKPLDDCKTLGAPQYRSRCVSGWTRADDLDVFSNGI